MNVKSRYLPLVAYCLLTLPVALLRADRDTDRRNEHIPLGHEMHPPLHLSIVPFATSSGPTGYTPQQLRHAYGVDQLGTTGQGQIIAIVDAFGSPTIQADLNTFCAAFGIPSTTVEVFNPQGKPATNTGWATETSLDVEWAHAIAPGATIALIASKSAATSDLFAAIDFAVSIGAKQVSMSWGGGEFSTEASSDFHFNVPGVGFFASSGDSGAGAESPASSPFVVGVGGTTLNLNSSANVTSETAWSGSGGGVSAFEPIPSFQVGWLSGTKRGVPDVAYDANPNTGVPVFLTGSGWGQFGGTSMAAPQWAALFALANSLRAQSISSAPGILYSLATSPSSPNYATYYHDIISGSNGHPAGPGYDLVTGLGSPHADELILALAGISSSPQVGAPVFSPGSGTYSSAQIVSISTTTSGASIRYTTNGSTPSETAGTLYSGPVSISATTTLKAIAFKSGDTDSPVTSATYTIGSVPPPPPPPTQVAAPAFSPAGGTYSSAQIVTISTTTSGASIRYTTNGSTPSETAGTLYSGPVSISATTILEAIAFKSGDTDSPVTSATYTISTGSGTGSPVGQTIWLKALSSGRFVSADLNINSSAPLDANRTVASTWEQFQVIDAGNGTINLKANATGLYVSADQTLANVQLVANRTVPLAWEQFQWVSIGGGQINLKSVGNGKFVSADTSLSASEVPLVANSTATGTSETFTWGVFGGSTRPAARR